MININYIIDTENKKTNKKSGDNSSFNQKSLFYFAVLLFFFVLVSSVHWNHPPQIEFHGVENVYYEYNVSKNVSDVGSNLSIAVNTVQNNITWDNGTIDIIYKSLDNLSWFYYDSSNFILTINVSNDFQTGKFKIPFEVKDNQTTGITEYIHFIINATNDEPIFTNVQYSYTFPTDELVPYHFVNLTDEEEHYPLIFSVEFFPNCTLAGWLEETDCNLFNVINVSPNSAMFNYTPNEEDIGTYWAQLTVSESNPECPHQYCNETYEIPHVLRHNFTVDVLSRLQIFVDDCANKNFIEGEAKNCTIEVRTRRHNDFFDIKSEAGFLYHSTQPKNKSWFFPENQFEAENFNYLFNVTINASRSLVGNWKINFSTLRPGTAEYNWSEFNIFVNWTGNSPPNISDIESYYNTSINFNRTISFYVNDLDFTIEDKNFLEEEITIDITMINNSNSEEITPFYYLSKGSITSFSQRVNLTFTPLYGDQGSYTVFVNITDKNGLKDSHIFTLDVLRNEFPYWYNDSYIFNFTVNSTIQTTRSNLTNINLNRNFPYANDSDLEDVLTFTYSGNTPPLSAFSLTQGGILNFNPWKSSVGYWEFNITATDDKYLSSTTTWKFNVSNINSPPIINKPSISVDGGSIDGNYNIYVNQGEAFIISLPVVDYDFLISSFQIVNHGAYSESLSIEINITNTTFVATPITLNFEDHGGHSGDLTFFYAQFTPQLEHVGNYSITLNVSDASGEKDTLSFNLSVKKVNQLPIIENIGELETTILERNFIHVVNATDYEDDFFGILLIYSITNISVFAPNLSIDSTTGEITFDFENNQNYSGFHKYRVRVNDSDGGFTDKDFNISVHGFPEIGFPQSTHVFNLTENSNQILNFTADYMINSTNLSYLVYMDDVSCYWINKSENNYSCNFSELYLKEEGNFTWNQSANLSFNLSLDFHDETYGGYKNLSLFIFNTQYPLLNSSINYAMNITHVNFDLIQKSLIPDISGFRNNNLLLDLETYFEDIDYFDPYHQQHINFSINQSLSESHSLYILESYSLSDWVISFYQTNLGSANISIIGYEWDDSNSPINEIHSNWFIVSLEDPPTQEIIQTTTTTRIERVVEHYSIKIIVPDDITVSPNDYIELDFALINDGEVNLRGIDLSSIIEIGGFYSDDITISLSQTYIESLDVGERKDFSLNVKINSEAFGDYRITIFANVTSPKINDWGEFFIKVLSLETTEISEILVFTDKLITENPECLELREIYNRAVSSFEQGDYAQARELANAAISACEDSISANEQIKFFDGRLNLNLIYSGIITLILFITGFLYYFYRRIKFKKSFDEEYI